MTTKMLEALTDIEIVTQTHLAADGEGYLRVGDLISLEYLSDDMDGVFETAKSWYAFLRGNFGAGDGVGSIFLEGAPKASTVTKWCMPVSDYKDKFVIAVGDGCYVPVDFSNLELAIHYDANSYTSDSDRLHKNGMPNAVEFFLVASLKEDDE